jgi:hypothetical protein
VSIESDVRPVVRMGVVFWLPAGSRIWAPGRRQQRRQWLIRARCVAAKQGMLVVSQGDSDTVKGVSTIAGLPPRVLVRESEGRRRRWLVAVRDLKKLTPLEILVEAGKGIV